MSLNAAKSIILRIGPLQAGKRAYNDRSGKPLKFSTEAKYLGLMASGQGDYHPQVEITRKKVIQRSNLLL